ncbi:MAG TPA: DUF2076 domain-containing protein [Roseiarcus sp.]|nr:DUF2076 domain-containing protein [Roseiarcus sp.]
MTPQERQLLGGLFQRVASTASNPRDPEAESFINEAVRMQPHAPYALAQTVLVQQQALEAAARRVQELEEQIQGQNPPQQQEGSFLGNLGRSLFGGGQNPPAPRSNYDASAYMKGSSAPPPPPGPQQSYPPQQNYGPPPGAGPWGAPPSSGGGFLHNALTTAAGVAGGMMAADALRGMFGGHAYGMGGGYGLGGLGGGETVVNNYYENADPAGQQAQDTLQDMDQDQDDLQDAADDSGGFDDSGFDDNGTVDT